VFDCGHTDVRTYIRKDVRTDGQTFLPGLLGHLLRDDLIILVLQQNRFMMVRACVAERRQ